MIKEYFHLIGILTLLLWAVVQKSARGITSVGVEPIVGYERVQMLVPTPHTKDRLVYGLRASYGFTFLSAEAEYLHAYSTESFLSEALSTKDTADKVKLGVRSSVDLIGVLSLYARLGGQATRNRHEETTAGVLVVTNDPIKYHPYAGAGLRLRLGRNLKATGDLTTVFHDFPNMNQNEYQATAGFVVQFP